MTTHIALLRGINVGGHKKVAMSDLRNLLAELGFDDPRSLLQSGNLVFRSSARAGDKLEGLLEARAEKQLDLRTDFFVRTPKEWNAIIAANPFRNAAENEPSRLVVLLLKSAPSANDVKELQAAIVGSEVVRAAGRHAYIVYPNGIGRSRLTNALIEKKLGTHVTGRNWNTVLKLGTLADGSSRAE